MKVCQPPSDPSSITILLERVVTAVKLRYMEIPVLIERVKRNGYRARGTEPFALSARGATREEALAKLRTKIQARLKNGTEVVGLEISTPQQGWTEFAGMFKDDPGIDDWIQSMAEYRQQVEDDPNR